jgi:hypothetical protein
VYVSLPHRGFFLLLLVLVGDAGYRLMSIPCVSACVRAYAVQVLLLLCTVVTQHNIIHHVSIKHLLCDQEVLRVRCLTLMLVSMLWYVGCWVMDARDGYLH